MKLDEITAIYDRLAGFTITLHSDPSSLGPKYLQDAIATCNNYKNATSGILSDVMRRKHEVSRKLAARQAAYQVSFDELLANDKSIQKLPAIEDRRASINVILRSDRQAITQLEIELKDIEAVEKVVRHRHKELSDTMGAIKAQRSLIRDELDTKSFYGDERSAQNLSRPNNDELDEAAIARLLEGDTEEAEPKKEPAPSASNDEKDLQAFLAAGEKSTDEEDFSDVFSSI